MHHIRISAILAAASIAANVNAVDKIWIDNANQAWTTSSNWNPGGMPGTFDTAIFNLGNVTPPYLVLFLNNQFQAINAVADRLRIDSNPITFTVAASTLTLDSANITETGRALVIGRSVAAPGVSNAVLENLLSQLNTTYATLGQDAGSSGTLNVNGGVFNVTGTNAVWDLIVGRNGSGTINVNNGSDVSVADDTVLGLNALSSGTINVNGSGSLWTSTGDLQIGSSGNGTLTISGDASVVSNGLTTIGYAANSNGTVNISGANSDWTISIAPLVVGDSGTGTLTISDGAEVQHTQPFIPAVIGASAGSSGIVNVNDAGWFVPELVVGDAGSGTLNVNGGYVGTNVTIQANECRIGDGPGTGHVSITQGGEMNINWVIVGSGGTGTLDITQGLLATNLLNVGYSAKSNGHVIVEGSPSRILTEGLAGIEVVVGNLGSGVLEIRNGGEVDVNWGSADDVLINSTGQLIIDGGGSKCSARHFVCDGSAEVIAGGKLDTTGQGRIGANSGSSANVHLDGVNAGMRSRWDVDGALIVGQAGDGALEITAGAEVFGLSECFIGSSGGGSGTVIVDGVYEFGVSELTVRGMLEVGGAAAGALHVSNGAQVRVIEVPAGFPPFIGEVNIGSQGIVTVSGLDSLLTSRGTLEVDGELQVSGGAVEILDFPFGNDGGDSFIRGSVTVKGVGASFSSEDQLQISAFGDIATLTILDGAVAGAPTVTVAANASTASSVTVSGAGSTWGAGTIQLGGQGTAVLTLSDGGTVAAASLQIGTLGEIHGDGAVVGTLINGGLVSPGASAAALDIDGNFTQTLNGTLVMELASASSFDQLLVTSVATVGGTLIVNLIDGFVPSPGQSFTIISADDVDGTFATVNAPAGLEIVYTATSVVLQVPELPCPADISNDGQVNVIDLLSVISAWGACPNPNNCPADINGDDQVNVIDLLAVINAWGMCP